VPASPTVTQSCIATVFWLMLAEISPLRLRGFSTGTAVFGTWMANFLVTLVFLPLNSAIGGIRFLINAGTFGWRRHRCPASPSGLNHHTEEESS
jgi:hypothetical protein